MKYVYLIKDSEDSKYKIGTGKNPNKRRNQLQTGNANELIVIHEYPSILANKIEKILHKRYSYCKKTGEWFNFSLIEELNFIEECKNIEKKLNFLIKNQNPFI
jgi:hypothetical protein